MKDTIQTPCRNPSRYFAASKRRKISGAILLLAGLLAGSANAQLLHRYTFTNTNDTVGTANGTLNGSATLSGGALVTAGGNGAVSGGWGGSGPCMVLSTNVVAGLTNAFTIEDWFSCSTGWPKYDSLFAFSDGTTANYLLGNPVMGYSPWPSGCNIAGGGGSGVSVWGIYLDSGTKHQVVLTFDGTTFTWYIDGAVANYSGYSPTASDPGFNLSTLKDVGINGGSPWGDPALTGSTYDFRIYGQALTSGQVAVMYGFGSGTNVSNATIATAIAPATAFTWDGNGSDNNWSTGGNWVGGTAPTTTGTSLTFANGSRTSPNMNANYSVTGVTFSNNASSFTLGAAAGNTLTLLGDVVNNSANTQRLNEPLAIGGAVNLNAASGSLVVYSNITLSLSLAVAGSNNVTLNGNITGSGTFNMNGAGTLTLGGGNVSAGLVSFNNGTSLFSGTVSSASTVSPTYVGYLTNSAVATMSGGTFNVGDELRVGASDQNGATIIGSGAFTMNGGVANLAALTVARGNYLDNTISGTVTLNRGSTMISTNDVIVQFAGKGVGQLALNGGTFIIGPAGTRWLMVGCYDSGFGELNLTNGSLLLENDTCIKMCRSGNTGGNVVNQVGGTVTFYGDAGVTVGGSGNLDLNYAGGSSSVSTYNLDGGILTVPQIMASSSAGSGIFDFNGGTLKPTASTASFMQGLTAANVMAGGAVIDTTNYNITIAQELVSGASPDGGLTKLGSGRLTLSSGYSYTGPTVVNAGTLSLDASQTSYPGNLTVNGATLNVSLNNGNSSLNVAALAFTGASTLNLNFGTATTPGEPACYANSATSSGTTTINITGQYLVVGQYPLVYTGTSTPTTNFKLGTLPTGVAATLVNSEASLDLLITASGQSLTWYGADSSGNPLTIWNINTSSNWWSSTLGSEAAYLQYANNSYGDNVTFDDTLYTASDANITLNTLVVPVSVTFNNNSTPYSLTGAGGIGGATSVAMYGSGLTYLGTANTYTGGTLIAGGTLSVTNDKALGAATAPVTLAGGTLQFNNRTASTRSFSVVSNSTITLATGANVQLSGIISGNANLTENGPGTLALAGAETILSVTAGGVAGNSVMNIAGTLITSNLFVGNVSGASAAVWQTGGTVNINGGTGDNLNLGNWDGSFGYFNAAGGTMSVNGISIGGEENPDAWPPLGGGDGLMEVNGETINNIGWITLARGSGPNNAILNVYSGSLTYSGGGLACNWNGSAASATGTQTSIINILDGAVTSTNEGVYFRTSGNVGILNLNGGLLSGTSVGGYGTVNFNGGTLESCAGPANPFVGVSGNIYVYGGGATINDGGQVITISQPLLAPTGYGVSSITLPSGGGSGYIAPPIVAISGGTGSNATAIAQINLAAGTITNILVTCPGTGYSSSDTLTVSFSDGGNSAVPPASATVNLTANTSGGLTKQGSGTVTLDGVSTYTGPTTVKAGTLAGAGTIAGALTNSATLAPGDGGNGTLTVNGNLTLGATSTNIFAVNGTTLTNASVIVGGNVTYGGVLNLVPTGAFTSGQQFQLFSGTGATNTSNFASIQGSPGSGLAFTFANGVLTVVSTGPSGSAQLISSISGSTLNLTWPAGLGWRLVGQTNSLSGGLNPNASAWSTVPGVNDGSASLTIDPNKPAVFYRLVYP